VLTNFVLFINFGGNDQLLRLVVGLIIALLDLTLQQQTRPFRKRSDDALSCVVQLMLVLFFVLGIILKLCDTDGFCSSVVGIDSAYTASVLMICVGLIGVLVPIGMVVRQLFFARPVPILRDARTMEPPKLLLSEGERYHLFLCPYAMIEPTSPHTAGRSKRTKIYLILQEPHLEHRARPVCHHQAPVAAAVTRRHRVPRR
tara:strand:+ start:54 stop:656 length:603 start_codon:yes stop_codon:yes gene_type:complete